jgi:hypothetical protein
MAASTGGRGSLGAPLNRKHSGLRCFTRPFDDAWRRRRLGRAGYGWHPRAAGDRVAQGGHCVDAVLGGGGQVAADRVPVPGGLLGAEPPGDFLLGLGWPQVPLGLVGGRRDPQVVSEAEDVVLPVAQARYRQPP